MSASDRLGIHGDGAAPTAPRFVVPILIVWTLFVWAQRLFNIWTDDALTATGKLGRTSYVALFVVLAIVVAATWFRRRRGARWWLLLLAAWTIVFWAVRGVQIAFADHSGAFIVVHTVLAMVSILLATAAATLASPTV